MTNAHDVKIADEIQCKLFVDTVRRARRIRMFAGIDDKTELYKTLVEDLDRDSGSLGGGDKTIAVSATIAAFCSAENI